MVLLPGDYFDCVKTYVLTQGDVDYGRIVNKASVSGIARDVKSTEVGDAFATLL